MWCALALAAAGGLGVCVLAARSIVTAGENVAVSRRKVGCCQPRSAVVEGDAVDIGGLSKADSRVLASQLGRLGRRLRGTSTERIARFFESAAALFAAAGYVGSTASAS